MELAMTRQMLQGYQVVTYMKLWDGANSSTPLLELAYPTTPTTVTHYSSSRALLLYSRSYYGIGPPATFGVSLTYKGNNCITITYRFVLYVLSVTDWNWIIEIHLEREILFSKYLWIFFLKVSDSFPQYIFSAFYLYF